MRNRSPVSRLRDPSIPRSGRSLFGRLLIGACCAGWVGVAMAADGAALFEAKCAACHSVGGGPKLGPDLEGVVAKRGKEWAVLAIVDPQKAGLAPSMPDLGLTQAEGEAISAFLDSRQKEAGKTPAAQAAKAPVAPASPEDIGRGQKLFEGSLRFANGGPACNACHDLRHEGVTGGGTLASDLTRSSIAGAGEQGLAAMLANAPFPVMQVAYEGKAVKPDEVRALAGFLQRAEADSASQKPARHGLPMVLGGAGGLIALAGLFSLTGARRRKGGVNQEIYDRQLRSE